MVQVVLQVVVLKMETLKMVLDKTVQEQKGMIKMVNRAVLLQVKVEKVEKVVSQQVLLKDNC